MMINKIKQIVVSFFKSIFTKKKKVEEIKKEVKRLTYTKRTDN